MEQRLCMLQSKTTRVRATAVRCQKLAGNLYFEFIFEKMGLVFLLGSMVIAFACSQEIPVGLVVNNVEVDDALGDTELLLAFVIFRHGDRTPDHEELELYASEEKNPNIFFPYGMKALTNKGKQRGFRVGEYLRSRYDGFISQLYIPDEISIRTTDFARTKMTALTALAGLYPPLPAQKWNPALDWQPIPYDTLPYAKDDLLYWYNCPRYLWLRDRIYELPDAKKKLKPYQSLFSYLSEKTGANITQPEHVFFLDNLFQTVENVGVKPPKWAQDVMSKIKEMTKIEYALQFYNSELTRLAAGVLMTEIFNATNAAMSGDNEQPKLRLYSAHENNVAALMAAARVFHAHQPNFGSTFSLEFRRHRLTGQYGFTAVYSPTAGGPDQILPIGGCGGVPICDYDTFLSLAQDVVWPYEEFRKQCALF